MPRSELVAPRGTSALELCTAVLKMTLNFGRKVDTAATGPQREKKSITVATSFWKSQFHSDPRRLTVGNFCTMTEYVDTRNVDTSSKCF